MGYWYYYDTQGPKLKKSIVLALEPLSLGPAKT